MFQVVPECVGILGVDASPVRLKIQHLRCRSRSRDRWLAARFRLHGNLDRSTPVVPACTRYLRTSLALIHRGNGVQVENTLLERCT